MPVWIAILSPIVAWGALVLLSRQAHRLAWVEHNPVFDLPFQNEQEQGRVSLNLGVHFVMSLFFAMLYAVLWGATGAYASEKFLGITLYTGLIHGAAVSLGMSILNSQKKDGFQQSILILGAHIVFALIYGLAMSGLQPQMVQIQELAESIFNSTPREGVVVNP